MKTAILVVLLFLTGGLAYGTYQRTYAWHDAESLLSDAIEKYPMRALLSYKWRGNYYFDKGDFDKALDDYNVLVELRSADAKVYDKVAVIYSKRKDYKHAMETFEKSLSVQDNVWRTYVDRSMTYVMTGDTQNALKDYLMAYRLNPKSEQLMADSSFQYVQTKRYDAAITQYNMLILLNSANPFFYFYRGVAYFNKGNTAAAMADWEIAVRFNTSKDVKQSASYNLSVAYDALEKDSLAVYYAEMAQDAGYKVSPEFMSGLKEKKARQVKH
jgi:tetratricopeptide (TPR) repeat protein